MRWKIQFVFECFFFGSSLVIIVPKVMKVFGVMLAIRENSTIWPLLAPGAWRPLF